MNPLLWGLPTSQRWYTLEHIKTVVEISAYAAVLAFFIYKVLAGYVVTGLSVKVACDRARSANPANDHLSICAAAKKGKTGTLRLHDAQARITVVGAAPQIVELVGIERQKIGRGAKRWHVKTRRKIVWETAKHPFLNLTPGDEGQFSIACEVPRNLPATVEVVILGTRLLSPKRSQWRSTTVSLPNLS
jgi:hypothetical protein